MAYSLITSTLAKSTNSTDVTTPGVDTTGANLIVVGTFSLYSSGDGGVLSDSKSNTPYVTTEDAVSGRQLFMSYFFNPSVGASHTWTFGSGCLFPMILVAAFYEAVTSPLDDQSSATTTSSGTTLQTGQVDPTEDNELLVTVVGSTDVSATGVYAIDGGFTKLSDNTGTSGAAYSGSMAYLIQTSAASANPTWTVEAGHVVATRIKTFKGTAAAVVNNYGKLIFRNREYV